MDFENIKNEELKNILEVHYNKEHEVIRHQYSYNTKQNNTNEYLLEKNLKKVYNSIKERTNDDIAVKIRAVAEMIGAQYRFVYPIKSIDRVIKNNIHGFINESYNNKKQTFINELAKEDKELFNRTFDNKFMYSDKKFVLNFSLNEKNKVVVKEAYYIINEDEKLDLSRDFEGMALNQVSILLKEFNLTNAKNYIESKTKEFIYKTDVIDDIYRFIMLYIMTREPNVYGAKRALLFAADFKADLSLPIRYAISTKDMKLNELLEYYYCVLNGKDNAYFYPNYFENQKKVIKSRKAILLSEINISNPKKRRR